MYSELNKKENLMPKMQNNIKDIFEISDSIIKGKENGSSIIIPHVCNNANVFTGNFAHEITDHYPEVKTNYHLLGKNFLSRHPGYVQFIDVDREPKYNRRLIVASMIAQNSIYSKNRRTLNYAYLVKSMIEVKKYALSYFNSENKLVLMISPKAFKAGGGNWSFINNLIEDVWGDLNTNII